MLENKNIGGLNCNVYSPDGAIKRPRRGIVLLGSGTPSDQDLTLPPPEGNVQDSYLNALCQQLAAQNFVAAVVGYKKGEAFLTNGLFDQDAWSRNTQQMSEDFNNVLNAIITNYCDGNNRHLGVVGGISYSGFILAGALANWGVAPQLADIRGLMLIGAGTAQDIAEKLTVPVLNKVCDNDQVSNGDGNLGGNSLQEALKKNLAIQAESACETDITMQGHQINPAWVPWFIAHLEQWLPPLPLPNPKSPLGDTIRAGEGLKPDQYINSQDQRFKLIYQSDGNLVLYKTDTTPVTPLWMSGTNGQAAGVCVLEAGGNLVIYTPDNRAIWSTNVEGAPGSHFTLQNDGNGVIYQPDNKAVWATNSQLPRAQGNIIKPGEILNVGQSITSPNKQYTLTYQVDGNLVLCKQSVPLWASGTNGKGVGICIMQTDGNLVIYTAGNHAIWASNTNTSPNNQFILQDDGNGVIYQANGVTPLWATNTH